MFVRCREVDGHRDARDLVRGHLSRDLVGDEGRVRADDRHRAFRLRVVDDLPDVGPHERLAAGEDDDRVGDGDDVVDGRLDLVERELALIVAELGGGTAVRAAEVAAPRDLPRDDARRLDAGPLLVGDRRLTAAGPEAHAPRPAVPLPLARPPDRPRDAAGMPAGARSVRRQRGGAPGGHPNRDRHRGLAAAGLGGGHLGLVDRALFLAELAFELQVGTGRRISYVLSHGTHASRVVCNDAPQERIACRATVDPTSRAATSQRPSRGT